MFQKKVIIEVPQPLLPLLDVKRGERRRSTPDCASAIEVAAPSAGGESRSSASERTEAAAGHNDTDEGGTTP